MRQFRQYGCTEFHGIVNYKKQLIKAYFSENEEHFDTIWYDEDKPLGTGGGLSLLKGKLSETFFLTNGDLLIFTDYEKLLRFHRENGPDDAAAMREILSCDLLILDDLGTEYTSAYTVACLYNIINTRILCSRPTVISTNLGFDELAQKYDQRITSRIAGAYSRLVLVGNDIRYIK